MTDEAIGKMCGMHICKDEEDATLSDASNASDIAALSGIEKWDDLQPMYRLADAETT